MELNGTYDITRDQEDYQLICGTRQSRKTAGANWMKADHSRRTEHYPPL